MLSIRAFGRRVRLICLGQLFWRKIVIIPTFILGAQKNRLTETVLLSTHNIYLG